MKTISAEELKKRLSDSDTDEVLVDVREMSEFAEARIPEAQNIPLRDIQTAAEKLKNVGTVYVHCASGARSSRACQMLIDAGVHAINVEGGLNAWEEAGFTIVKTSTRTIPLIRQVMIAAGSFVLLGMVLGVVLNPWWYALSGFVGAGLLFAGLTGKCGMMYILARMPWNKG